MREQQAVVHSPFNCRRGVTLQLHGHGNGRKRWRHTGDLGAEVPRGETPEEPVRFQETPDCIQKIICGDSTAAVAVVSTPDGPWRTSHLRLRCNGFRERVQQSAVWAMGHKAYSWRRVGGRFLTKPITVKARWQQFFDFMRMTVTKETVDEKEKVGENKLTRRNEVKKLVMAGTGLVALSKLIPGENEQLRMVKTLGMGALTDYVAVNFAALQRRREKTLVVDEKDVAPRVRCRAEKVSIRAMSASSSSRPSPPAPMQRPGPTNAGPTTGMDRYPYGGADGSRTRPRNRPVVHTMFWGRDAIRRYLMDRDHDLEDSTCSRRTDP